VLNAPTLVKQAASLHTYLLDPACIESLPCERAKQTERKVINIRLTVDKAAGLHSEMFIL
jgi:hypothetical protein